MSVEWMQVPVTPAPGFTVARDPRRAYAVVDMFERELEHYTGAPYAITTDSCTNALMLCLTWTHKQRFDKQISDGWTPPHWMKVTLPKRTYVGVMQAACNAGYEFGGWRLVDWSDEDWQACGWYAIEPDGVVDSARRIAPNMYAEFAGRFVCLSFNAKKQLALGNGGAILTDNDEAAQWFRAARMDGRPPGSPIESTLPRGWHCPLAPPVAALGLWRLSDWVDKGYEPAPLPEEEYPDLSLLDPDKRRTP